MEGVLSVNFKHFFLQKIFFKSVPFKHSTNFFFHQKIGKSSSISGSVTTPGIFCRNSTKVILFIKCLSSQEVLSKFSVYEKYSDLLFIEDLSNICRDTLEDVILWEIQQRFSVYERPTEELMFIMTFIHPQTTYGFRLSLKE